MKYKTRKDFYPINFHTPEMNQFQKSVERKLTTLAQSSLSGQTDWHDDLTRGERSSLKDLEEDQSIVIRNSDKGGLVVVMKVGEYRAEAIHQLSNTSTYLVLKSDLTKRFRAILSNPVERGLKIELFKQKKVDVLVPKHPVLPTFYNLPKTHKGLVPLHGRPIISGIGSLIEKLGQWLDKQLQSLVVH